MIGYFDTSGIVPLLVEEPCSPAAARLWDAADRVVSVRLVYPEGRAALAQARRSQRIDARQLRRTVRQLEGLCAQLDLVEVDARLARRAGELAEEHALRGYDAVHLAAAEALADDELVVVAGDVDLCAAATARGYAVASLTAGG